MARSRGLGDVYKRQLGEDYQATAVIEDNRGGPLREIAKTPDLVAAAEANGIKFKTSTSGTGGDNDREREKKARAETAWRTLLLDRLLWAQGGDELSTEDLRAVALALFHRLGSDAEKRLCGLLGDSNSREAVQALLESIDEMAAAALHRLLLAMAYIGQAHVAAWQTIEPPAALLAAAERWGVDVQAVKNQAAETRKSKPAKAGQVRYRHPDWEMTWSGKGKPPKWVQDWLAEGNTLDDIEVVA
jgi:hypothetical protein